MKKIILALLLPIATFGQNSTMDSYITIPDENITYFGKGFIDNGDGNYRFNVTMSVDKDAMGNYIKSIGSNKNYPGTLNNIDPEGPHVNIQCLPSTAVCFVTGTAIFKDVTEVIDPISQIPRVITSDSHNTVLGETYNTITLENSNQIDEAADMFSINPVFFGRFQMQGIPTVSGGDGGRFIVQCFPCSTCLCILALW